MSSPGANGLTHWPTPESQGPSMSGSNNMDDNILSTRPMRLKVLYTFDDQNKTNCLARWPHVLQIQTVAMDESTSIGVIELKTCIQAIVQCSPELVARLGQDYTVYAYDYSEYDNPLVGQGMLSWALATASPTPDGPAHESRQLITGRVCKNILGIFTNGVKETLEVKLRLVPVPTVLQSEYLNNMEKYRELSKVIPPGFDHNEWTSFLQSNPNVAQMASKIAVPPTSTSNQRDGVSLEVVNQLLSPSMQQPSMDHFNQASNTDASLSDTRAGTPNGSKAQKISRPSSRVSVKRPRAKKAPKSKSGGGNTSGYEEGTDGDEGSAPKKRAKITKTDWKSKSSFGSAPESLRVAASTAGSLRLFRPIAMSPATNAGSHLQELPRAPTPVPNLPNQRQSHDTTPAESDLQRNSLFSQTEGPRKHVSPYPVLQPSILPEDQVRFSIESANPSPERNPSPGETPPDIGSSPPVMRTATALRSSPPCPSSPDLPQMPRTDSGFMSGSLDDLFGEDDDVMRPIDDDDVEVAAKYARRRVPRVTLPRAEIHHGFAIEEETPGPVELLPTKMLIAEPKPKAAPPVPKPSRPRANSIMSEDGQILVAPKSKNRASSRPIVSQPEPNASLPIVINESQDSVSEFQQSSQIVRPPIPQSRPSSRMMIRTASLGSLTLPAVAESDPVLPPSTLQRSETWSEAHHSITDAPMPTDPNANGFRTSQNAKKQAIRQKLETAIANGEMPPFCSNCGAIETSTWRKAWSQEIQGTPGYHDYSDEPGRVTAIDILTRDARGNPTSYRLIKKSLLPEEDKAAFKEFILCNPCGIWMSKYKSKRPEEMWENTKGPMPERKPSDKKRAPRPSKSKKAQSNGFPNPTEPSFPQSEKYHVQSEAYQPHSEVVSNLETVSPTKAVGCIQKEAPQNEETDPACERRRSSSVRPMKRLHAMTSDAASVALRRAIQSSPARWIGTQHSPIEVEDNLGSTCRLLFPSPRKDSSPKVLGEVTTNIVTVATEFHSPKDQTVEVADKENCPPAFDAHADVDLIKLFEEEMARPTTPVQKPVELNAPFKTPSRPTPNHRPITRSISRSIRSAKSPGQILTLFQRTPSRTPCTDARRRSPRNHQAIFESPFTATLNQLMSEANNAQSPSRNCHGLELDFGTLPSQGGISHLQSDADMNFHVPGFDNQDFFSTDVPMPSSPPRMFHLYEDPHTIGNIEDVWNEFGNFDARVVGSDGIIADCHAVGIEEDDGMREVQIKIEQCVAEKMPKEARDGADAGRQEQA